MDMLILVVGVIVMITIFGAVMRPGGPDPQDAEDASQVIAEGGCGLLVISLISILIVGFILLG